jgi:hypothetical protein
MVWYAPQWEITQLWVILGLVGIANTIVVGAAFLGPEAGRIAKLGSERGPEDPEIVARTERIFTISRYDLSVLVLVVVDMVVKPGLRSAARPFRPVRAAWCAPLAVARARRRDDAQGSDALPVPPPRSTGSSRPRERRAARASR